MAKPYAVQRAEKRIPMGVAVRLFGHERIPGDETAFTDNISSRGARVVTEHRWQPEDRLTIALLPGDFCSTARVVYCQPQAGGVFAIGLEFLKPVGQWVVPPPVGSGESLHG